VLQAGKFTWTANRPSAGFEAGGELRLEDSNEIAKLAMAEGGVGIKKSTSS
jgi:hypothetical protein